MPRVVVVGDGLAARVGYGVAGPDVAAEGEAVVGAAVGDAGADEVSEGGGEPTPARVPGAGACRWRARSTAAPATRRAQATMTAPFSQVDEIRIAALGRLSRLRPLAGGLPAFLSGALRGASGLSGALRGASGLSGALRGASGEPVNSPYERLRRPQRQGPQPRPGREGQPGGRRQGQAAGSGRPGC